MRLQLSVESRAHLRKHVLLARRSLRRLFTCTFFPLFVSCFLALVDSTLESLVAPHPHSIGPADLSPVGSSATRIAWADFPAPDNAIAVTNVTAAILAAEALGREIVCARQEDPGDESCTLDLVADRDPSVPSVSEAVWADTEGPGTVASSIAVGFTMVPLVTMPDTRSGLAAAARPISPSLLSSRSTETFPRSVVPPQSESEGAATASLDLDGGGATIPAGPTTLFTMISYDSNATATPAISAALLIHAHGVLNWLAEQRRPPLTRAPGPFSLSETVLPMTHPVPGAREAIGAATIFSLFGPITLSYAFTTVVSVLATQSVGEREKGIRSVQITMGKRIVLYWFFELFADFCALWLGYGLSLIVFFATQHSAILGSNSPLCAFSLFVTYAVCISGLAQVLAAPFNKSATAGRWISGIVLAMNLLATLASVPLRMLRSDVASRGAAARAVMVLGEMCLMAAVPPLAMIEGLTSLADAASVQKSAGGRLVLAITAMLVSTCLSVAILVAMERRRAGVTVWPRGAAWARRCLPAWISRRLARQRWIPLDSTGGAAADIDDGEQLMPLNPPATPVYAALDSPSSLEAADGGGGRGGVGGVHSTLVGTTVAAAAVADESVVLEARLAAEIVDGGPSSEYPIALAGISKRFKASATPAGETAPREFALPPLSLLCAPATTLCLLGSNGAGKSTAVNIMVGSLAPTSGSGFVGGVGIGSASASTSISGGATESSPIGICPQSDPIYDNLSPLEHIVFFLGLVGAGGSTGEAQRCLDAVGMEPAEMTKRSKNLSGGNKRKLTLAIALTCLARAAADGEGGMPPVVVLDEPTVGLDPQSRSRVWRLLDESRRRFRACIVLCTHHMEEAERLAQKVMIVKDGLVQCVGTIDDLRARFGAGYRIEIAPMAGTRARPPAEVDAFVEATIAGAKRAAVADSSHLHYDIPPPGDGTALADIFEALLERGPAAGVRDFTVTANTIESVFLNVMDRGG